MSKSLNKIMFDQLRYENHRRHFQGYTLKITMVTGDIITTVQYVNRHVLDRNILFGLTEIKQVEINEHSQINAQHIESIDIIDNHSDNYLTDEGMAYLRDYERRAKYIVLSEKRMTDALLHARTTTLMDDDDL